MKILEKIQNAYWKVVPRHLRPGRLWYRFKCWVWHRYSTVKPRSLPHTWVDRTDLMPHMIFEILSDFIEGECGEDTPIDWYYANEDGTLGHRIEVAGKQVNVRDEMQNLYDWWHKDYLVNIDHLIDGWAAHRELHVTDIFTRSGQDDEDKVWSDEIDPDADGDDTFECGTRYSSPEAEIENKRLFTELQERKKHYADGLNSRLHRVINIIPYLWT